MLRKLHCVMKNTIEKVNLNEENWGYFFQILVDNLYKNLLIDIIDSFMS